MFDEIKSELLTFPNFCYLATVLAAPLLVHGWFYMLDRHRDRKRSKAGLPSDTLIGPELLLASQRTRALTEALSVVLAIALFPFAAQFVSQLAIDLELLGPDAGVESSEFKVSFAVLGVGVALSSADVIRSYVSGLLFYASITFVKGVQVGDRATLLGHTGKITRISPLFIQLATADDDFVTLPTAKLWQEPVVSVNAGRRPSLCVMPFHLSTFATTEDRQNAEHAIWESIQSSPYVDLGERFEILISQDPSGIVLTAKACVASTYRELEFKSDVMAAFLAVCDEKNIPIGSAGWERSYESPETPPESHDG